MDASIFDDEVVRVWHVHWQTSPGRNLLRTSPLARRIRSRLLDGHRAPGRALLFFLLTNSEIHVLTALPADELPSAVAHGLANVIARWVRDVDGLRGQVFATPYEAYPIRSLEHLLQDLRILAWRPVRLGLSVAPSHFGFSAARSLVGAERADGFDSAVLLRFLGSTLLEGRAVLRSLLADRPSEIETLQWELERGIALATGAAGPLGPMSRQVRGAAAVLVAASASKSIAGALALLERWVEVKVKARDELSLVDRKDHLAVVARSLVANLAVQSGLCSAGAVARYYGRAKATLSEQMAAGRKRPRDRQILAIPMARIVHEALALELGKKTGADAAGMD